MNSYDVLESHIKGLISSNGSIPLDQFLSIVIPYYYQSKNCLGSSGDFITAPEASQMFGEILGVWVLERWLEWEKSNIELIELGPGNGLLMSDLLRATKNINGFHNAIKKIHFVEISKALQEKQREAIAAYNIASEWHNDLGSIAVTKESKSIIIANEFFDTLPIKQFIHKKGVLYEVHIGLLNGKLQLQLHSVPFSAREEGRFFEDQVIEVSSFAPYYAKEISRLIKPSKGAMLIIDYGYSISPNTSTIQAIRKHKYTSIFENLGESDITSLVNFTELIRLFKEESMNYILSTQFEFLTKYGIKERAEILIQNGAAREKITKQLEILIGENFMGSRFKVLELFS